MSLDGDFLLHALRLVESVNNGEDLREVNLRRAVSASYYALFHRINGDAVRLFAPDVPPATNHRIQRWFEHAEMKRVCGRFLPAVLDQPLRGLIGSTASIDLQTLARAFIQLQEARHNSDYDLGYVLNVNEAFHYIELAVGAMEAWDRLAGTPERNIFILSLLLWKNWERERA